DWIGNQLTIGTQAAGTGTLRGLTLETGNNGEIRIHTSQTEAPIYLAFYDNSGGTGARKGFWGMANSAGDLITGSAQYDAVFRSLGNSWLFSVDNGSSIAWKIDGTTGNLASTGKFLQWTGQTRVTADVNSNNTTTLAIATGLTVALQAGRTYSFEAFLSFTCTAAQGIRAAMVASGGLTATDIRYDGWIVDSGANGIKGNAQAAALGGVVASAALTRTAGQC